MPEYNWLSGEPVPGFAELIRRPEWDFHVEWFNLTTLVIHTYGRDWRGDVRGQNTYRTYDVDGDPGGTEDWSAEVIMDVFDRWANHKIRETITDRWERDRWDADNGPNTDAVLWHLCRQGIIPAGRYLVTQWW